MSNDARRKEKRRLKREKKKAEHRRVQSISPYKRIGQIGEIEACYINSNWQENGLASIHVIRRNPSGGHALACFLIDIWCAGLKDAWGRIDLLQEDIEHNLNRARESFDLTRIDIDTGRKLVAAAIRFSRQNGFRLPAHYDRWVNLLGGIGDVSAADLSAFGKDGKLLWIGPVEDLRRRLIGCSPEEFFQRPDVEFTAGTNDLEEFGLEESDDDADERFKQLADRFDRVFTESAARLARELREEIQTDGQQPPERLDDAARYLMAEQIINDESFSNDPDWNEVAMIVASEVLDDLTEITEDGAAQTPIALEQAIQQALPHLKEPDNAASANLNIKSGISNLKS